MAVRLILVRARDCDECDRQRGIWDQVKRDAPAECEFREVDFDHEPQAAAAYDARMHPTIVLEKAGVELRRWIGVTGKFELLSAVRDAIEGKPERGVEVPSGPAGAAGAGGSAASGAVPGRGPELPPRHVPPPGGEPSPEPMEPPGPPGP